MKKLSFTFLILITNLNLLCIQNIKGDEEFLRNIEALAREDKYKTLSREMKQITRIEVTTKDKDNILHIIASLPNVRRRIFRLFRGKVDPNAFNSNGYTPLHCAVNSQNLNAFKELLSLGADCQAKRSRTGLTLLEIACAVSCNNTIVNSILSRVENISDSSLGILCCKPECYSSEIIRACRLGANCSATIANETPLMSFCLASYNGKCRPKYGMNSDIVCQKFYHTCSRCKTALPTRKFRYGKSRALTKCTKGDLFKAFDILVQNSDINFVKDYKTVLFDLLLHLKSFTEALEYKEQHRVCKNCRKDFEYDLDPHIKLEFARKLILNEETNLDLVCTDGAEQKTCRDLINDLRNSVLNDALSQRVFRERAKGQLSTLRSTGEYEPERA